MAYVINGKQIAQEIKDKLKDEVANLKEYGKIGSLAVIQVGNNKASDTYVRNKRNACKYIGIEFLYYQLDEKSTSEKDLLLLIDILNNDDSVKGILVQLPLPDHINEDIIINHIDPKKDIDCFHPQNVGALTIGKYDNFLPCTPAGILYLLKQYNIKMEGKNCVIVGRSNIVGKPLALLMLRENATVTITHSKTKNLKNICRSADILIVAIGKQEYITADYIKPGAVVIDVGIHVDSTTNKLCGDVKFDEVEPKASYITPVPGGIGPMTVAMLMCNCVKSISNS